LCATVFYTKLSKGKLYPKAARTGPYAFAQEVSRVRLKVVTKYVGIVKVPKDAVVIEKANDDANETDVIENKGEEHDNDCSVPS